MDEEKELDDLWEAAGARIDEGDPTGALSLLRTARKNGLSSPVLDYLEGLARSDLDDVHGADASFARAREEAGDWAELVIAHAWVLFRLCRFEDAATALAGLSDRDLSWDAWMLRGLLEERLRGDAAAEISFRRAARLAPEGEGPSLLRVDPAEFQKITESSLEALPPAFREALDNVAILVRPFPDAELLAEDDPPLDPESLGLFTGAGRGATRDGSPGDLPNVIMLFQRNLERMSRTKEELEQEIAITLYHEIGHYLGFDEEDMPRLGLD